MLKALQTTIRPPYSPTSINSVVQPFKYSHCPQQLKWSPYRKELVHACFSFSVSIFLINVSETEDAAFLPGGGGSGGYCACGGEECGSGRGCGGGRMGYGGGCALALQAPPSSPPCGGGIRSGYGRGGGRWLWQINAPRSYGRFAMERRCVSRKIFILLCH